MISRAWSKNVILRQCSHAYWEFLDFLNNILGPGNWKVLESEFAPGKSLKLFEGPVKSLSLWSKLTNMPLMHITHIHTHTHTHTMRKYMYN